MSSFEIVDGLTFVPRGDWGADRSLPRLGHTVSRHDRTHVIIHHTVMIDDDETPNIWESSKDAFDMMKRLQVIRKKDLGADVPYSFVAFFMKSKSGLLICEGRGEDRSGAHTKGHNTKGIGISFAGDFENYSLDQMEISRRLFLLSYFLGWLKWSASHAGYGQYTPMSNLGSLRPKDRNVFVHRDVKATACPGEILIPYLSQVDFLHPVAAAT